MVALPTGGMIILAAKEVVGQGFNGIAGMSIPQCGTTVASFLFPGVMLAVMLVIFFDKTLGGGEGCAHRWRVN